MKCPLCDDYTYHMKSHIEREHGAEALERIKDLDTILKRADRYL